MRLIPVIILCLLLAGTSPAVQQELVLLARTNDVRAPIQDALFIRQGQQVEIILKHNTASEARWFLDLPESRDYTNLTAAGHGLSVQPIAYQTDEIVQLRGRDRFRLDDVPALARLGTHELTVTVGDRERHVQVVVRRDDSFVGFATELVGVPFVYAPTMTREGHQTDLRKGADCIAMIVYARRRQGIRMPYIAPPKLYDFTVKVGDRDHQADTSIREGDLLHFGFQTAIIAADLPPRGTLSDNDVILHTYHGLAETARFSQLPYKAAHFDVLRWKE